jgi:hypothetical protein
LPSSNEKRNTFGKEFKESWISTNICIWWSKTVECLPSPQVNLLGFWSEALKYGKVLYYTNGPLVDHPMFQKIDNTNILIHANHVFNHLVPLSNRTQEITWPL